MSINCFFVEQMMEKTAVSKKMMTPMAIAMRRMLLMMIKVMKLMLHQQLTTPRKMIRGNWNLKLSILQFQEQIEFHQSMNWNYSLNLSEMMTKLTMTTRKRPIANKTTRTMIRTTANKMMMMILQKLLKMLQSKSVQLVKVMKLSPNLIPLMIYCWYVYDESTIYSEWSTTTYFLRNPKSQKTSAIVATSMKFFIWTKKM